MCGIVGLYLKTPRLQPRLGELTAAMLVTMTDRGPDSAGFAVYGNDDGALKITLRANDADRWHAALAQLAGVLDDPAKATIRDTHAVIAVAPGSEDKVRRWAREQTPPIDVVSIGRCVEIYKETGLPRRVTERFDLAAMTGTHAIGHTRMATESAVTTNGAHPF